MSKYNPLWEYLAKSDSDSITLSYDDIEKITGFPIDHSFLTYKKELLQYGWSVGKISLKNKTVSFKKNQQ